MEIAHQVCVLCVVSYVVISCFSFTAPDYRT
jgi:hypothetical protein